MTANNWYIGWIDLTYSEHNIISSIIIVLMIN